jgi:hypothetical protein
MVKRFTRKMKGGELAPGLRKKIKDEYKLPTKLVNELGGLVNSEEEFFGKLQDLGILYPKTELPKLDQKYINQDYETQTITESIDTKTYAGLFPIKATKLDAKWVYTCGVCPADAESCSLSDSISFISSLKPEDGVDITSLIDKISSGCKKIPDVAEVSDKIYMIIEKYSTFFIKYLYFLPWALESNESFYRKSIDYGIKIGFLNNDEKNILTQSLSWQMLDCQPCIINNGRKEFCIDPFYLNESIEWVSNKYVKFGEKWSSSEGLARFRTKAAPMIEKLKKIYNIENFSSSKPEWWIDVFDKYDNDYAIIIMCEQNKHKLVFQKLQFFMTTIKLVLSLFVIFQRDCTNMLEEAPIMDTLILTPEIVSSGCAASMGRIIESKMKKLEKLFTFRGFERCREIYQSLDPHNREESYVTEYNKFIDTFIQTIDTDNITYEINKVINKLLTRYKTLGSPLYLNDDTASGDLGICSEQSADLASAISYKIRLNAPTDITSFTDRGLTKAQAEELITKAGGDINAALQTLEIAENNYEQALVLLSGGGKRTRKFRKANKLNRAILIRRTKLQRRR